ncbi:phosphatidylserine decarboxylase [Dichomitus squalens]|uniref:phosphatidylserine decarboxylase n=1 Tax=Dichomitus squalens TaxID=114155 RepID=A0A4V2K187_9APHY|nr:phosphatidylserine decarboxylase [Dichomitus squalens]
MQYAHAVVDYGLQNAKLVQQRQVGWLTKNRKTGELVREQMPLMKKARMLLLFNPVTEWVDRTHLFRYFLHEKTDHSKSKEEDPRSREQIKAFVDYYKIDMSQFEPSDIDAYKSFQDFFIRHLKPGTRPIAFPDDPSIAVCVADCRMIVYDTVDDAHKLWIKGRNFSIAQLIQDKVAARPWANGAVASFRLSPQDYHRYHSPVRGLVRWWKELDGDYYSVDPICIRSDIDVLAANARSAFCLSTKEFGDVLFVAIGALEVGTVTLSPKITSVLPGSQAPRQEVVIEKGEEVGFFEFGGSSIVVAFEPGRIRFDEDLKEASRDLIEIDVEMGMQIGRETAPTL